VQIEHQRTARLGQRAAHELEIRRLAVPVRLDVLALIIGAYCTKNRESTISVRKAVRVMTILPA
jgi:hypothetical protein